MYEFSVVPENFAYLLKYSVMTENIAAKAKFVVSLDDVMFPSNSDIKHIQAWKLDGLITQEH